jgi:ABC-type transport system involved in cytochrome c biogenesis permease component
VRSWINYAGAFLAILMGISLYSWDPGFLTAGTPALALPMIIAGLVWGGLALNSLLREQRYYLRSRDGLFRAGPARGAGYRKHRGLERIEGRSLAEGALLQPYGAAGERGGVTMNAPAAVTGGSFVEDLLRIATKEVKQKIYDVRISMWAVLSGIVLSLTTSDLLLTDKELSLLEQSEILYIVTSLAIGLGLIVAGILAADPVAGEKEWATLESMLLTPTRRGALLFGKVWGVMAAWLLIFVISAPYILVVGFGTSVVWAALICTFVVSALCVAGFATLTAGISALSRSGRGVTLVSMAIFIAMAAPTLLDTALQKSWFGNTYNALSPLAQARLSLESVIVDKESLLVQLPHIGALAAFAVIAGVFAAFAARGVSLEGGERHEGRGDLKPWGPHETSIPAKRTGSRPADPEEKVRL